MELKGLDTLKLRGWGGVEAPYLGYTECRLEIPEIKGFNEDVLMLVVNDTEYGARIPVLLGTLHINMILDKATLEEIKNLPRSLEKRVNRKHGSVPGGCAQYGVPDHEH